MACGLIEGKTVLMLIVKGKLFSPSATEASTGASLHLQRKSAKWAADATLQAVVEWRASAVFPIGGEFPTSTDEYVRKPLI